MIDSPEGSADTRPSGDDLPKVERIALVELLESDGSAFAMGLLNVIKTVDSPDQDYAAFGNAP
jgi:hypothetical protein